MAVHGQHAVVVVVCGTGTVSVLAMMKQPHQQNSCCRNVEDGSSFDHGGSNIYHYWCTKEP